MDPIILGSATKVVGILSPYVAKTGEEFVKAAGQAAYDKSKSLLETLRKRFSGDKEATETLNSFEREPAKYKHDLWDVLKKKISQDKDLAEELQERINDIGPQVQIIINMDIVEDVVGLKAKTFKRGKANVKITAKQGNGIVGAEFEDIG